MNDTKAGPSSTAHAPTRPRGRPKGSVAITDELFATITGLIRAGTFDYVAAEAAGISERTFREWIARGEGRHPTRLPPPRLRAFAEAVTKARAEARALAETSVYRNKPESWLRYAARSRPGRDGWSDEQERKDRPRHRSAPFALPESASEEQIVEEIKRLDRIWQSEEEAASGDDTPDRGDRHG